MGTNQGDRQAAVRALTGTAYTYEGDWHALFDQAGIPAGAFNGRMLTWLQQQGAAAPDLPGAQAAFALNNGVASWSGLGAFYTGPLAISGSPAVGTQASAYSFRPAVQGGRGAKNYTLGGSLPAGLSFSASTGLISGTPSGSGTTSGLTITVSDTTGSQALGPFSLTFGGATLAALTLSATSAITGQVFNATIGGQTAGSTITATASDGTALTVSGATVSGTFGSPGSPSVTLTETLAGATNTPRASVVTVSVSAAAPTLNTLTVSPGTATVGTAYTGTISGQTSGSALSLTGAGAAGLSISGATINGTPTTVGAVNVVETLSGATNSPRTSSGLSVAAAGVTLNALTVSPNTATIGTAYTGTISGRTSGSTLTLSGAGASGLSISGTAISGTPTTAGAVNVVETLAGATNSPRTSSGVLTVATGVPAWVPANSLAFYDFQGDRAYSDGQTLPSSTSGLAVSRASVGYDLAATTLFASNAARRTAAGLLIEPARTNLWKASRDFTNGQYSLQGMSASKVATGNDGSTVCRLAPSAGTNSATRWFNTTGLGSNLNRAWSLDYKSNGSVKYLHARIQVGGSNYVALFDTVANSYLGAGYYDGTNQGLAPASGAVYSLGNGWYRATFLTNNASSGFPLCYFSQNANSSVGTWTGSEFIDMDHIQVEDDAAYGSSPVDTTTAAATRAADAISLTLPATTTKVDLAYDNGTTTTVSAAPGSYTVPANPAYASLKSLRAYAA